MLLILLCLVVVAVDGAIHRAGGKAILDDCKKIIAKQGGCKTGEAVITSAGNLPAKFVIHTVGPVWHGGKNYEAKKLEDCYRRSLQLAEENNCRTIAFPGISTGVYRFSKKEAAKIAVQTVYEFISAHSKIEKIILVCFDDEYYEAINQMISGLS